ncbi:MAG TPA: M15 family metallopeptidase [Vicinamibacterales bacterium]|nr:M15 family metallopeptidase [Vicinamibacterales bacterium]
MTSDEQRAFRRRADLDPLFDERLDRVLSALEAEGYRPVIKSARRSQEEQQALFRKGRNERGERIGPVVTELDGVTKKSRHQLGRAADVYFQQTTDHHKAWARLGELARAEGLVWGGDWKSLVDKPHVELPEDVAPSDSDGIVAGTGAAPPASIAVRDTPPLVQGVIDRLRGVASSAASGVRGAAHSAFHAVRDALPRLDKLPPPTIPRFAEGVTAGGAEVVERLARLVPSAPAEAASRPEPVRATGHLNPESVKVTTPAQSVATTGATAAPAPKPSELPATPDPLAQMAEGLDLSGLSAVAEQLDLSGIDSDKRSVLAKAYDKAFSPIPAVQRRIEQAANWIDTPELNDSRFGAMAKGFAAGALQGAGENLLTPGDVALTATGPLRALKSAPQGLKALARLAEAVGMGGMIARGSERIIDSDTAGDTGAGAAQVAFGLLGASPLLRPLTPAAPATPPHQIVGQLKAAPHAVTPEGVVLPPGAPVPAAAKNVTPAVAEGPSARPAAVMGRSASGQRVYSSDPHAVPVDLPPAGVLPERAASLDEFVAVPGSAIARKRDVLDVDALARQLDLSGIPDAPPPAPAPKGGRARKAPAEASTVPAAVMDFHPSGQKVYSSDPSAPSVKQVPLDNLEVGEVRRMLAEMDAMPFTKHSFVDDVVGKGGSLEVVPGGAGARVYDDVIQQYGGGQPGRAAIADAMQKVLEGEPSVYGPAIREVARLRLGGRLRGQLPPDAGDLPQSGRMTDDDYLEFARFVDREAADVAGDPSRLIGESGAVNAALLANMGGAAVGAATGAAAGSTPEEKIKGALLGGGVGFVGSNLLQRGAGQKILRGTLDKPNTDGTPREKILRGIPDRLNLSTPLAGRLVMSGETLPTTGRPAPRPGTPHADPMQGTEAFLGKFAPEIREGITEVLERNGGFDAQRRGVVNQADVERLAEGIAVDLQRTLKPGTALNAEAVRSHVDALATAQSKVNELAAKVARGGNTDADVLALQAAKAEVQTIAASVMGARSEAGRALAQWRMLARVLDTGNPELMADAARVLRGEAAEFAAQFSQLPNDPLQRFRWLQQHEKPSTIERARQYYLSNILSGLKTHERNFIGNAANALTNIIVHPAAVGVDALRSAVTGAPRTAFLSEIPSQTAGALLGVERGIQEALFSLRHGVNRSALTQSLSAAEAGKLDVPRIEFGGGGMNPLNWPGRALDAADQFFRAIARNTEAYGLAHAQARREGLRGDALQERMAQLLAGAGDEGQKIAEQADKYARRAVFQEKAGPLVGNIQAIAQKYPALSFVVPFIRTPANILRQGFEFSPAGFGMQAARAGGREGSQAMARAGLGSLGVAGLAWLAASGRLSGNGPSDPIDRAQLMESGWRPNAVRVGDRWVGISLFQPISVPAMAIANAFESWRDRGMREADAPTKALEAMRGFGQSVLDLSFMSGVADLFAALSREGSASSRGAEYAGRIASGFVPLAGAQRTVAQAMDPTVRAPEGFTEQVMTGLPGLSDNVPARMDRFGRDVQRPGGAWNVVDPFNVSKVSDDPVFAEVGRVRMGRPSSKVAGAELSRAEERELQKLKGTATYAVLQRAIASPGYQRLSDADKAEVLDRLIDETRRQVQEGVRGQLRLTGRMIPQGAR